MSRETAVRYVLGEPAADPRPLTRRETQVAELVAAGLTNKQIADQLFISPRTADTHIDHIMGKLGFKSRAQIAAWIESTAH
jgi:non-specific serine/threonine protein kinase